MIREATLKCIKCGRKRTLRYTACETCDWNNLSQVSNRYTCCYEYSEDVVEIVDLNDC